MSWKKTGVILLITAVFTRMLPFSSFFQNVNTLFHELAHALTALVLNGKVMHIYLFADQSGVTYTSFTDSWVRLPIGLAGYIGASCFAVLLFMVYRSGQQRLGLKLIVAVTASSLVLFVRNDYGIFWCLGFTLLTTLLLLVRKSWLDKGYFLLIAFICLVESFISSVVLLMLAISEPTAAGDATGLALSTGIPALFWAILFVLFSSWCARLALSQLHHHSGHRR